MKYTIIFLLNVLLVTCSYAQSVLVEAESFDHTGNWVVDQQFIASMGSPYLLAHGMGKPVENASTEVMFPKKGEYHYWVRTKDWIPDHPDSPGRFRLIINGKEQANVFGTNKAGWEWVYGGKVAVKDKKVQLELKDITGFEGRCDAIYFSIDERDVPPGKPELLYDWRNKKLGIKEPALAGEFDLVIVGGGLTGCCAAVAASRKGLSVALINDRPVLGGNASREVRVHTEGLPFYTIVGELNTEHYPNGHADAIPTNDTIMKVVKNESNIHLFMNTYVNKVSKLGNTITDITGMNIITSERLKFKGTNFVDATGDGWVGYYAGARYMMGRESKSEFNESMAPETGDSMTMGTSVLWNSYDAGEPSVFPEIPWAMNVSKDYKVTGGEWFWEYGLHLNTIYDAEQIRDHLLRAIYGTWANVKADSGNVNLKLKWVGFIGGKRESRRLLGEYVLKEQDVISRVEFEDGFVEEVRAIDIHYPKEGKYDFLTYADFTRIEQYKIPYRCLISKDITNLFIAGRCFSATHIGLGSPRVMHTCGQMGVVVGAAASVCKQYDCSPMDVYHHHLNDLKAILAPLKINQDK